MRAAIYPHQSDLAFSQFPFTPVGSCDQITWLIANTREQPCNNKRAGRHIDRRRSNYLPNLEAMIWHGITYLIRLDIVRSTHYLGLPLNASCLSLVAMSHVKQPCPKLPGENFVVEPAKRSRLGP